MCTPLLKSLDMGLVISWNFSPSILFYCSGEKGNPTYVPPEVAVKTTEFAEEEAEIELQAQHSARGATESTAHH